MKHFFLLGLLVVGTLAQTTNAPKRLPPPGIAVPESTRAALQEKLKDLQRAIAGLLAEGYSDWQYLHLPDAQVYEKAVRYALEHNEFYRTNEFGIAEELLREGLSRIREIGAHQATWTGLITTNGSRRLVVRGYRSKIDGSAQPYGVVIPPTYRPGDGRKYRLDVWLHGRDERLTELRFIHERSTKEGEFTPPDTFVLHAYGRYCNAFKFAGEVDVIEALEAAGLVGIPFDPARVVMRGFSMGGAGVWHLATHYADRWVAAAPGAGFAETAQYLRVRPESVTPWERLLWQWYDAPDYAANLWHCPVVAYSGELDKQRQAADVMAAALGKEGLPLVHLIGPRTEHKYEPGTKKLLIEIIDTFAAQPKAEFPSEVRLTTRTLRYPKMHWLILMGLEKHWERADARGSFDGSRVRLQLTNVTALALDFQRAPGARIHQLEVNGVKVPFSRRAATNLLFLTRTNDVWAVGTWPAPRTKSPGLQGPIDDAFMDSFVFVTPSGGFERGFHAETSAWLKRQYERAAFEWRAQFRGDAPIVTDTEADAQIPLANLVLWGDPQSNQMIRKLLPQLPIEWTHERLKIGEMILDARSHVPLMIFPNPLNPEKYIVLNSGFTFRGFGSNADQTPKLPDYALIDVREKEFKNAIRAGGFFDERWRFDAERLWRTP